MTMVPTQPATVPDPASPAMDEQAVPETAGTSASRRVRLTWGAVTAVSVALGYLLILLRNRRFFLQDDSESALIPNWLYVGDRLHRGELTILTPDAWMAGNWTVDGQNSRWNPTQLVIAYIAPMVDRLDLMAAGVKCCFAVLLALGVYRVALAYGARPAFAAVVGAAMPFSGWVLYYDSASWVTSLFGLAWVTHAWASSVRYARGRSGPIPMFAFTYLALSVGYVHSAIGMALVALCVIVGEALRSRSWVPAAKVFVVALAAGLCGLVTYLPAYLTSAVTWRVMTPPFNSNMFTAPWSESLNAVIPTTLPAIQGFSGSPVQHAPVSYIGWFILPVLAFVDWRRARALVVDLAGPLTLLVVMLIVTAGPSDLGPVRWPARLLPLLAVPILVLTGVLASRAASLHEWRRKAVIALVLTVIVVLRSASAFPLGLSHFALWGLVLLASSALVIAVGRQCGVTPAAGAVLVSILAVLWVQVGLFPTNAGLSHWNMPTSRSAAKANFPDYQGVTLQLGQRAPGPPSDAVWRSLVFGNYARTLGLNYVNNYAIVGHLKFSQIICIQYAGATCGEAQKYLFTHEPTTGLTYADLMGLDRVVLVRNSFPNAPARGAPSGWHFVPTADALSWVLERDTARPPQPGRVVTSPGVTVTDAAPSNDVAESMRVTSPGGGSLVFSRLWWPGYTATLDGRPVPVDSLRGVFVTIRVPAGTQSARLDLSYTPPGTTLGLALAGVGVTLMTVLLIVELTLWRRRRAGERTGRDAIPGLEPEAGGAAVESQPGHSDPGPPSGDEYVSPAAVE